MRGTGLRVRRAVTVQKRNQMRPIRLAVPPGSVMFPLHCHIGRETRGGFQRRERPRMQLVGQRITQGGVVSDLGGHRALLVWRKVNAMRERINPPGNRDKAARKCG